MRRLFFLQARKKKVNGALVSLVVLPGFAGVDKVQQRYEILFFLRGLIPNVADQGAVIEPFRLDPEIFPGFLALALSIQNQGVYKLQNILLRANIGQRVIFHGFLEVDQIEAFDPVFLPLQECTDFREQRALRKRFVKTECAFYLQTFYEQLTSCLDGGLIRTLRRYEYRF